MEDLAEVVMEAPVLEATVVGARAVAIEVTAAVTAVPAKAAVTAVPAVRDWRV